MKLATIFCLLCFCGSNNAQIITTQSNPYLNTNEATFDYFGTRWRTNVLLTIVDFEVQYPTNKNGTYIISNTYNTNIISYGIIHINFAKQNFLGDAVYCCTNNYLWHIKKRNNYQIEWYSSQNECINPLSTNTNWNGKMTYQWIQGGIITDHKIDYNNKSVSFEVDYSITNICIVIEVSYQKDLTP